MIAYKFPLYPNKEQQVLLWEHSCLLNSLYNRMLQMEQEEYEKNKKFLNFYTLNYMLPKLKQETPALRNIFSQSLQQVMKRVNGWILPLLQESSDSSAQVPFLQKVLQHLLSSA